MPPDQQLPPDRTPLDDDKLLRDADHQDDMERINEAQLEELGEIADSIQDVELLLSNMLELHSSLAGTAAALDVEGIGNLLGTQKQVIETLGHINDSLVQMHESIVAHKETTDANTRVLLEELVLEAKKPLVATLRVV